MIVGVGTDLVDIVRVERLLRWKAERALARLFTPGEVEYAGRHAEPAQHYAVRLAAKEAAFKALAGNALARSIGWREIEVVSEADGRPRVVLHGAAAARAAELGVRQVWVSLTHSATTAGAIVILEGNAPGSR